MLYIIITLLVGTSFAPFLMPKLDIWHAQQIWCQLVIMIGFSWSFFEKKNEVKVRNLPLAVLSIWITLGIMLACYMFLEQNRYNIKTFLLYFNFITILILYNLIIEHINLKSITLIMDALRYTVIVTLLMATLQQLGFAQFFDIIDFAKVHLNFALTHNCMVVGFIGNGTHLSGFLSSTIPLFLWSGKRVDYLAITLMLLVMCFTGTTVGDPAMSGFIVAVCLGVYFYKDRRFVLPLAFVCLLAGGFLAWKFLPIQFFSSNGRILLWGEYLKIFKQMPITGLGLGAVNLIYKQTAYPEARHLHMELFHYTFELGLIGGAFIIWLIKDFLEIKIVSTTELALKAMVIGFLISSCFNYPAHLWLPGTWAMFAYASLKSFKNKEII